MIFCGHFPDGAEKCAKADMADETRGQWYLRQMLGSANFGAGPAMSFMSGNLCHQIEHHLYPDLPSNRLHEISLRVRRVCDKYDLPYTTGSFPMQYGKTWRTIAKLSLPERYLRESDEDAPETRRERMFGELGTGFAGSTRRPGAAVGSRPRSHRSADVVAAGAITSAKCGIDEVGMRHNAGSGFSTAEPRWTSADRAASRRCRGGRAGARGRPPRG